jgi:hypothetical protein
MKARLAGIPAGGRDEGAANDALGKQHAQLVGHVEVVRARWEDDRHEELAELFV